MRRVADERHPGDVRRLVHDRQGPQRARVDRTLVAVVNEVEYLPRLSGETLPQHGLRRSGVGGDGPGLGGAEEGVCADAAIAVELRAEHPSACHRVTIDSAQTSAADEDIRSLLMGRVLHGEGVREIDEGEPPLSSSAAVVADRGRDECYRTHFVVLPHHGLVGLSQWVIGNERGCSGVSHCRTTARRVHRVLTMLGWAMILLDVFGGHPHGSAVLPAYQHA